ncbi:MAG: carboxypeptidase regulatory-like domain-containing protein, partial [Planctomycetes bacterium]|nr:carboxypeptidase regulatory-like domain-containing protein [Planctomycetota bacterium]
MRSFDQVIGSKQTVLLTCVVLVIGTLAWLAFGSGEAPVPPASVTWTEEDFEPEPVDPAIANGIAEDETDRDAVADPTAGPGPARTLELHGRVVDGSSTPLAEAEVTIHIAQQRGVRGSGRVAKSVRTDADGRFRFAGPGQANDRLQLLVTLAGFAPHAGFHEFRDRTTLDLGDIVLRGGGIALGAVVDEHGNPVRAAEVTIEPSQGNRIG